MYSKFSSGYFFKVYCFTCLFPKFWKFKQSLKQISHIGSLIKYYERAFMVT